MVKKYGLDIVKMMLIYLYWCYYETLLLVLITHTSLRIAQISDLLLCFVNIFASKKGLKKTS